MRTAPIVPVRPSIRPAAAHLLFAGLALITGCSEPLYDATQTGTRLTDWRNGTLVTSEAEFSALSVTTASGVKLSVEGSRAMSSGKQVPTRIVVTLEENPVSAEISIVCRAPSQFDGDPLDVLTAICTVAEQNGTESFLGSKESHQDVSMLRVKGDGSISLS